MGNGDIGFGSLGLKWHDGTMPGQPIQAADVPPIQINSCLVGAYKNLVLDSNGLINAALIVKFKSSATQVFKRVVWRARYGNGWIDFNDVGTFSPGTDIENDLWIENSGGRSAQRYPFTEFQNYGAAADCAVELTESADGTVWSRLASGEAPFLIPVPLGGLSDSPSARVLFEGFGRQWSDGTMPATP